MRLNSEATKALNNLHGRNPSVVCGVISFNLHKIETNFLFSISHHDPYEKTSSVRKFTIKDDGEILNFFESVTPYGKPESMRKYVIDEALVNYCCQVIGGYENAAKGVGDNGNLFRKIEELGFNEMPVGSVVGAQASAPKSRLKEMRGLLPD